MEHARMSVGQTGIWRTMPDWYTPSRGFGWYDATDTTGYRGSWSVECGDYCAVELAREHAPRRIPVASQYYDPQNMVGAYAVQYDPIPYPVHSGDYCRIDSDAAWLHRSYARYGQGRL
jgi:hypothetical protein